MPEDQHDGQHDGPDDGQHEDQLAEQDRVRRLLADLAVTDAAHPAAVPGDVATRLDAALRDAARETRDPSVTRPLAAVVPLRRRWAPALVAAAAVVVVGGIGVAAVTQSSGDSAMSQAGGSASDSSDDASLDQPSEAAEAEAQQEESGDPGTMSQSAPTEEGDLGTMQGDVGRMLPAPYVTLGGFADGVATLVAQGQVATGADAVVDADELRRVQGSGCVVPDPADGAATLVSLEGDPAVLVVAPPTDGRQQVEVRSCAAGEVLAQSEVTAVG